MKSLVRRVPQRSRFKKFKPIQKFQLCTNDAAALVQTTPSTLSMTSSHQFICVPVCITCSAAPVQPSCILARRGKAGQEIINQTNATSDLLLRGTMASRLLLGRIQSAGRLSGGQGRRQLLAFSDGPPLPPAGGRLVCSSAYRQIKTDARITVCSCSAYPSSIPES